MKKLLVFVVVVAALALGQAWAGDEFIEVYPCMPGCCSFDCVSIDAECGWCCDSSSPLYLEFLNAQQNVLGTAEVTNWCCGEVAAHLDRTVDSNQVCRIRLRKDANSCCVSWVSIRVLCADPCKCAKWKKVFKGDLWCWQPIPEPAPVPVPAPESKPEATPVPQPRIEPAPAAEPEQSFDYFPSQEEEEVVISVEGRG